MSLVESVRHKGKGSFFSRGSFGTWGKPSHSSSGINHRSQELVYITVYHLGGRETCSLHGGFLGELYLVWLHGQEKALEGPLGHEE